MGVRREREDILSITTAWQPECEAKTRLNLTGSSEAGSGPGNQLLENCRDSLLATGRMI